MKNKIKVLVIDDSALVRQTFKEILSQNSDITLIGLASDPYAATEIISRDVPDVIILDIEMPKMDGITFLEKIMSQHPIPVIICSTLVEKGSDTYFKALNAGAVEIIQKPKIGTKSFFEESKIMIFDAISSAASINITKMISRKKKFEVPKKLTADAVIEKVNFQKSMVKTTEKIVIVGASTGGTEALTTFLTSFEFDSPGIVIVQHMPEKFTKSFSDRLNQLCKINVKEAENNDTVIRGQALIAPGNKHMLIKRSGARYYVEVKDGPLVSRHRPSVDVLFRSAARYCGKNAIGVIMTGMGDDGAKGMLEMHDAGAYTIAQDEESCIVFGMPKEAIKAGGVDKIVSLELISTEVLKYSKNY